MSTVITETGALVALCDRLASADFVTVDTEFLRDSTYYAKLCLVQLAGPDEAAVIDTLAPGIDLTPLYALLNDARPVKVFHSARQDIEIFVALTGRVPQPLFDTQIAAMVCGFGDSVGYDKLVSALTDGRIDKTSRFTDWSRRPLTDKQIAYALADVTWLRPIYQALERTLVERGRHGWLDEEMAILTDPDTYRTDPEEAWRRIKARSGDRKFLAVLKAMAAWREREAQARDVPRARVLKDDSLLEIAARQPKSVEDLNRLRGVHQGMVRGRVGEDLVAAVKAALASPPESWPRPPRRPDLPKGLGPTVDLLRVLLKLKAETHHVAPKMIATGDDLDQLAADDRADVPALHGWRREVFGEDALRLKHGEIALSVRDGAIQLTRMPGEGLA